MELRKSPLPHDLQYVLDGGVEYGHITGGTHVACSLFGDIATMDRLHLSPHPGKRGWAATAAMCATIEDYGQFLIEKIEDPALKAACLGSTTTSFLRALKEYGDFVCGAAYEDAIWGGSMEHRHNTWASHRGRIYKRLSYKMRTDDWVKRKVRRHHNESGYKHLLHLRSFVPNPLPPATKDGFALLNVTLSDQRSRAAERSRQWILAHRNDPLPTDDTVVPKVTLKPAQMRALAKKRAKERRSIIRAATIASAIVGASAVSAFARGEPVRLESDQLVMEVRLGSNLGRSGHGGVNVVLKNVADEYLASLCVYQDLPALDQLASLALHVQAGEIDDVIHTGNVFNPSPTAFAHPALVGKAPPPRSAYGIPRIIVDADTGNVVSYPIDQFDVRQALMRGYEVEMGDRYRERVFIDVLGQREGVSAWRMFQSFREGIGE